MVVGNITIGGSGKTPLVAALAIAIARRGHRPGIVARGHLGAERDTVEVDPAGDPAQFGDEPVMLARTTGCPVVVGRDRAAAAQLLLQKYPDCDVLLADDGLQHHRLARDMEIAVFDGRGVMNGWLLPAGPMREPISRLETVDAIVLNGTGVAPTSKSAAPVFVMRLEGDRFHRLGDSATSCRIQDLAGLRLHAVAGIGAPERFFEHLRRLGLVFEEHEFPDHHAYSAAELNFDADALLVTEKDAVKLERLGLSLAVWVLPVAAQVTPDLAGFVLETIDGFTPA